MQRIARTTAVALLGTMLLPAAPAWAPRECGGCATSVLGRWDGSYQTIGNPDLKGAVVLEITTQDGRRFGGMLTGLGGPDTIPVKGTLAESDRVSMVGSVPGMHVVARGEIGDQGIGDPDLFVGSFRLDETGIPPTDPAEGDPGEAGPIGHSEGRLAAVQATGVSGEALAGHWEGTSRFIGNPDLRPVTLELDGDGTGRAVLADAGFNLDWAVGEPTPDGTAVFAAVGGGDVGIIIIGGKLTPPDLREATPATLEGDIRLLPADGGPDQEGTFVIVIDG